MVHYWNYSHVANIYVEKVTRNFYRIPRISRKPAIKAVLSKMVRLIQLLVAFANLIFASKLVVESIETSQICIKSLSVPTWIRESPLANEDAKKKHNLFYVFSSIEFYTSFDVGWNVYLLKTIENIWRHWKVHQDV